MFTRSTTGCYTCKARKKKCDEGRPKCQRCIRGGFECEGYALLSNPDSKGVMRCSVAPPPVSKSSHIPTRLSGLAAPPHSGTSAPAYPTGFQKPSPIGELAVCITRDPSGDLQYDLSSSAGIDSKGPPARSQDVQFHSGPSLWAESSVLTPSPIDSTANTPPTISHPILSKHTTSLSDPSFGKSNARMPSSGHPPLGVSRSYPSSIRPTNPPEFTNSRQSTALFQAPVTLSEARTEIPVYSLCATTSQASYIRYGPALPSLNLDSKAKDEQDDVDDEDGPGAVTRALCRGVTPDPNTRDNALPFVLQSYARWVNFLMFDPLRVIHLIRDNIITQFSNSEESRTRVILMSNVLGSLGKSPELNPKGSSLAELLRTEVCHTMANYCFARSTSQYDIDIRGVLHTLGRVNEIILVQRFASPFSDLAELMQGAAPVFRQACLEPPGQPVNLPNVLLHPDLNVRSFATTDILISITKGCPMMFKYDVSHTPEMAEQMADGEFGLQWLHGIPDQALILLAQINVLYENFGTSVDAQCISDLEKQIRNIRSRPAGRSVDPFATVWRLVVHECWRQAVYVYLYMVLCGARANDPRVLKAVRSFTRLANSVRPGRNPDAFLFLPMMVVGAAAYEPWDRDILRRRTLGLRECITPGTSGHECLLILVEIWERTTAENRPAVWHDLRLAALKIVGGA